MKKKTSKLLILGACAAMLTAGAVVALNNTNSVLNYVKGTDAINGSVTFSRSSGSFVNPTDGTYITSGETTHHNTVYAFAKNNLSTISSKGIANLKQDDSTLEIATNTSGDPFKFQGVTRISFDTADSYQRTYTIEYGNVYGSFSTVSVSGSETISKTLTGNPYFVRIKLYSSTSVTITSLTVEYGCSYSYIDDATLESLSVTGQKENFTVGDAFEFNGTVTGHYSDGLTKDLTNVATFSGYDMNEKGEQTVTVTVDDVQTSYTINVKGEDEDYTFEDLLKSKKYTLVYDDGYQTRYEVEFDFANNLINIHYNSTNPFNPKESYYHQTFTVASFDNVNLSVTFTSVSDIVLDSGSSVNTSTRRVLSSSSFSGAITNNEITSLTSKIASESGTNIVTISYTA